MPNYDYIPLGQSAALVRYDAPFPVFVFIAAGRRRVLLCDTHLGFESGRELRALVLEKFPDRELVVVNTHHHWDHVWGNAAFRDLRIIAQRGCPDLMRRVERYERRQFGDLSRGALSSVAPNEVFETRYLFDEDDIELISTPGHTPDSIAIYARKSGVLFAADSLELPYPYIGTAEPLRFAESIRAMLDLRPRVIATAHSGIVGRDAAAAAIDYFEALARGEKPARFDSRAEKLHRANLVFVAAAKIEQELVALRGAAFDMTDFYIRLGDLVELGPLRAARGLRAEFLSS